MNIALYRKEKSFVLIVAILIICLLYGTGKPQFIFGLVGCLFGLIYIQRRKKIEDLRSEELKIKTHGFELIRKKCKKVYLTKEGKTTHLVEVLPTELISFYTPLKINLVAKTLKSLGLKVDEPTD